LLDPLAGPPCEPAYVNVKIYTRLLSWPYWAYAFWY